jgi:hypothetical protein
MNAYELADCLEVLCKESKGSFTKDAYIMLRQQAEEIYELKQIMYRAINAGDWKVDGACDPDLYLRDFEPRNEEV